MERLRQVLWACALSIVMMAAVLLDPLDQFLLLIQARVASHQPSNEIVFVGSERDMSDPELAHRRSQLAEVLVDLDRRGVNKVYLDIVFDKQSGTLHDEALRDAISQLGRRIVLVHQLNLDLGDNVVVKQTDPAIGGNAAHVASLRAARYLGFTWEMPYSHQIDGRRYVSLGASLSGRPQPVEGSFPINYGIEADEIPNIPLDRLIATTNGAEPLADLSGKTVVIGAGKEIADARETIPGRSGVPASYVSIYAAETLKAGRTTVIPALSVIFSIMAFLIALVGFTRKRKHRWAGYAFVSLSLPLALFSTAQLGIRIEISYALGLLAIYGIARSRSRWKQRVSLIHQDTGLPTLRALEAKVARDKDGGHIVIAKIHGYESVLKTLRSVDQADYILRLVDRLRATDRDLTIYFDSHFLGWHSAVDDSDALVEHLEGLRAIFASAIQINGNSVDVGITFGVAKVVPGDVRRVPAAIAAAEETSEAFRPIIVAQIAPQRDLLWDISLRARIDKAMDLGEIYCVYQPKIDLRSGRMTGVEALVRWHDPERGMISPLHFIQQCEKAGRMEHLTRYVLQSACSAGKLMHFRNIDCTIAVNISATLLGDMRIVGMVRNVVQATGFDSKYLILEVTETSRIPDLTTARTILEQLKSLGPKISMDDFGVGAANLETVFELPFDEVKIDRLFVADIARDVKARAIARSVAAMGREAQIAVVAEGCESNEDLQTLIEIGCTHVQGYVISPPLSLTKLLKFNETIPEERKINLI